MSLKEDLNPDINSSDFKIKGIKILRGSVGENGKTVYYYVKIDGNFDSWTIKKRYSQFETLCNSLLLNFTSAKLPALPPKKIKFFTSHTSKKFIEERRVLLENYLIKLIAVKKISKSDTFLQFFKTDKQEENEKEQEVHVSKEAEVTNISIPSTRKMSDHVLYQIDVQNSNKKQNSSWTLLKRFGQFYDLDQALRLHFEKDNELVFEKLPPAPSRKAKIFSDHMGSDFIDQRRALLENYLKKLIQIDEVLENKDFLTFVDIY